MKIPIKTGQSTQMIKKIFIAGILLRILIMPWFGNIDIIYVHRRVEQIVCQNKTVFDYSQIGIHTIESLFTRLMLPINSCQSLGQIKNAFLNAPNINRLLFIFKIPYLLFEIGFWWLMWKFVKDKGMKLKKKLAIFLAFNPIIIYSVYLIGRFESYNLFFSGLVLYLLTKLEKNKSLSAILVSLAMIILLSVRKSYLMILPAFLVSLGLFNWQSILSLITMAGGYSLFQLIKPGTTPVKNAVPQSTWLESVNHPNYLFENFLGSEPANLIYLFFLLIGIIYLWWLDNRKLLNKKLKPFQIFSLFSFLTFTAYYATSFFHPQYFSWIVPFIFILFLTIKNINFLYLSFWLIFPFYLLFTLRWWNVNNIGLGGPISRTLTYLDPGVLLPGFSYVTWASIGRTMISAFCLYWIYYIFKHIKDEN